jgi:C1A family cysteine protease
MAKKKAARRVPPAGPGKPRSVKRYGWTPDLPDRRDRMYSAPMRALAALTPSVDLRPGCPLVVDQGELGSCTANAIAGALQFNQMKQKLADVFRRRGCSSTTTSVMEHTQRGRRRDDSRQHQSRAKEGAPHEPLAMRHCGVQGPEAEPGRACRTPRKHRAILYQRLTPTLEQLKGCLASGFPFVFGFPCKSFEPGRRQDGRTPIRIEEKQLGGHAVLAVGYDDAVKRFTIRNSWGPKWSLAVVTRCPMRI